MNRHRKIVHGSVSTGVKLRTHSAREKEGWATLPPTPTMWGQYRSLVDCSVSDQSGHRIDQLSSVSCSARRIEQLLSTMEFHLTNHCCRNKYSNRSLLHEVLRCKLQNFQAISCFFICFIRGLAFLSLVLKPSALHTSETLFLSKCNFFKIMKIDWLLCYLSTLL